MKKTWQPEELVEYWTLLPLELALLNQKNDENRLGFAILLKFFEIMLDFLRIIKKSPSSLLIILPNF